MSRKGGVMAFALALAAYAASVILFTSAAGQSAAAAVILPALVAGWFWGARGGAIGALLILPVSLFLYSPQLGVTQPLPNAIPHVIGVFMTVSIAATVGHVKDLKRALRARSLALEASEERYRQLVEHSPEGVIVVRKGVVLYANPGMARALGARDERALVGRTLESFAPFEDREALRLNFLAVAERATGPVAVEAQLAGARFELTAVRVAHGGKLAVMVLARDARLAAPRAAPILSTA